MRLFQNFNEDDSNMNGGDIDMFQDDTDQNEAATNTHGVDIDHNEGDTNLPNSNICKSYPRGR